MSYNPKVYNTVIQSGLTGAGTYNLAPIAYGKVIMNTGITVNSDTSGMFGAYNCTLTYNTGTYCHIVITHPTINNNYIPIISSMQGPNSVAANFTSADTLQVVGYASTGDQQQTNFAFVIYGS